MAKALPPIAIKASEHVEPSSVAGASLNNHKISDDTSPLRNNILTSDGVADSSSPSHHDQILRRQLHEESAA